MDEITELRIERNRLREALRKCLELMKTKPWGPQYGSWFCWTPTPEAQKVFEEAEKLLK